MASNPGAVKKVWDCCIAHQLQKWVSGQTSDNIGFEVKGGRW